MKLKQILTLLLVLVLLVGCLPGAFAADSKDIIGISMHTSSSERWIRDGETLRSALEAQGYDVLLTYTDGGDQAAQIDDLLEQNIKVLIVAADDPSVIGPVLEKVSAQGVKVLAYDRMPTDTSALDALVTFDSREVGRIQARHAIWILRARIPLSAQTPVTVDIIGGDRADPNARWLLEGALEVLTPYVEVGMIADPGTVESLLMDSWSAEAGQARMQALLDAGHKPSAILCGSDNLLSGALNALNGHDELPSPIMLGQDATVEIATKIGKGGLPLATVFKDTRLLAEKTAVLAAAMAKGETMPQADGALNNGRKDVPAYFAPVEIVDRFNYRTALISSGYYTAEQLDADPNATVTNGEFISMCAALNDTLVTDMEAWGIATGHINTELNLTMDTELTRFSVAKGIMQFCKDNGYLPLNYKTLDFVDAAQVPSTFVQSMEFCYYYGLYKGTGNNYLSPNQPLTRLQNELLFQRLLSAKVAQDASNPQIAYSAAVADAVTVEPDEILPLKTSVTKDDPNVTWNEAGDKVLMLTWNRHPERYAAGETVAAGDSGVWVFPLKELEAWYGENAASITDLNLRLEQLIGLPPDAGYTTMTALWISPEDLARPAYNPDITSSTMTTTLTGSAKHQSRFAENIVYSYTESAYPWTRLGYTYDWAPGAEEYGLTEFIIKGRAKVEVAYSTPTLEFFDELSAKLSGSLTAEAQTGRTYEYDDAEVAAA